MVKSKLIKLESKLSKLGFIKTVSNGPDGDYDSMDITINPKLGLSVSYDETNSQYELGFFDTTTSLCNGYVECDTEKETMYWVNSVLTADKVEIDEDGIKVVNLIDNHPYQLLNK